MRGGVGGRTGGMEVRFAGGISAEGTLGPPRKRRGEPHLGKHGENVHRSLGTQPLLELLDSDGRSSCRRHSRRRRPTRYSRRSSPIRHVRRVGEPITIISHQSRPNLKTSIWNSPRTAPCHRIITGPAFALLHHWGGDHSLQSPPPAFRHHAHDLLERLARLDEQPVVLPPFLCTLE